jgi:hypothetical protein
MDPRLTRIGRSYRRSARTRLPVALAVEKHGSGTIEQIADWTGIEPRLVRWAIHGSRRGKKFRRSASLLAVGVLDVLPGRGAKRYGLTELGARSLDEARREPTFAQTRASNAIEVQRAAMVRA